MKQATGHKGGLPLAIPKSYGIFKKQVVSNKYGGEKPLL